MTRTERLRPAAGTAMTAMLILATVLVGTAGAGAGAAPLIAGSPRVVADLAAGASASPGRAALPAWDWPLLPVPTVTRPFDPPPRPWLPGHRGVDLSGGTGQAVRAAGAGMVVYAGPVAGRGVVSIDHPGGLRTTYEPVIALVLAGETVGLGERIGVLEPGHPGCPVEACLHWGLRRGETYLDPSLLVWPRPVRLKPL